MAFPDTLTFWLKDQAKYLALIVLALALGFIVLQISARRRRERLAAQRAGVNEQTFSAHLEQYGFDPLITSATYRYLQEVQLVQFPILPADALDEDLGLDSEDVDQTVRDLSLALRREQTPGLRYAPLVTVEDLVRLLQASPRQVMETAEPKSAAA